MKVTLEDYNNRTEEMIATSASVCYDSKPKNMAMINKLKEHKHLATFRFAYAVIKIEDISTICAVQTLRTSFADMLDSDSHLWESQRYVNQSDREFVVPPLDYMKDNKDRADTVFRMANIASKSNYDELIEMGVKKEDARFVLTRAITTDLYIAGNMQMWTQFLKLRTDKNAQWEIRAVANEVALVLSEKFPLLMKEFTDEQ